MSGTASAPQRRRSAGLREPSTLRALTSIWLPFLALTYLLWSVPVRVCFHPRYRLDTRYCAARRSTTWPTPSSWSRRGVPARAPDQPGAGRHPALLDAEHAAAAPHVKAARTLSSRLSRASTLVARAAA